MFIGLAYSLTEALYFSGNTFQEKVPRPVFICDILEWLLSSEHFPEEIATDTASIRSYEMWNNARCSLPTRLIILLVTRGTCREWFENNAGEEKSIKSRGTGTLYYPGPESVGRRFSMVPEASACLASRGIDWLCSELSFQRCVASEHPWEIKLLSSSGAKGRHALHLLKDLGFLNSRFHSCNPLHDEASISLGRTWGTLVGTWGRED